MFEPVLQWDSCERVSRLCRNPEERLVVRLKLNQEERITKRETSTPALDNSLIELIRSKAVLNDELFLRADLKKAQAVEANLVEDAEQSIIFLWKSSTSELAELHIKNANMRHKGKIMIGGIEYQQLRFATCNAHEYLLHPDKLVIDKWLNRLKKVCTQTRFGESYTELSMIGKGNFAQVHSIERKSDKKLYAVKKFDKKLILLDGFEKVALAHSEMYLVRD